MPRNTNGVYSLPPGNPVVSGTLIESTWANPTMSDLGNEITQSLPRNGSAGMTGPLMLARDGILPKEATTVDQLNAAVSGSNSYMPAGAIQSFAMNAVPTGWLECNGSAVSRTTYANLFATIGTTYGTGNGTTTFNLPDMRGQFLRGFDNGKGTDPGRVFGSSQVDSNKAHSHPQSYQDTHNHTIVTGGHTHGISDPGHSHSIEVSSGYGSGGLGSSRAGTPATTGASGTGISIAAAGDLGGYTSSVRPTLTISSDGTESRPVNVAMIYCIKAFGALQTDGLGSMAFQNKDAVQITGGSAALTTASVATAPVAPDDAVRLSDLQSASGVKSIISSDPDAITISSLNPAVPVLEVNTNVPNGLGKLNAVGQFPPSLIPLSDINYQGPWDASTGDNPSEAFPLITFNDGDMYQIAVAGTITLYGTTGLPVPTLCDTGSQIIWTVGSPTLPTSGWYYNPVVVPTSLPASSIEFTPAGTIAATDVQAAIVELDSETQIALSGKAPSSAATAIGTSFTPAGSVAANNVQAAIVELDAEKLPLLNSRLQVGTSSTPTSNFTLTAEADDGTMKLARGNKGATTQDVMTVDAAGKPDFTQLARLITGGPTFSGYITLPGGLVVQWGALSLTTAAANAWVSTNVTLSIPWPTAMLAVTVTSRGATVSNQATVWNAIENGNSQITISMLTTITALSNISGFYIAIGY